jgi:hypothetical protein
VAALARLPGNGHTIDGGYVVVPDSADELRGGHFICDHVEAGRGDQFLHGDAEAQCGQTRGHVDGKVRRSGHFVCGDDVFAHGLELLQH